MIGSIASTSRLTLSAVAARRVSTQAKKVFTSPSFSTHVSYANTNANSNTARSSYLKYGTRKWIHSSLIQRNAPSSSSTNTNTLTTSEYERISDDDMDKIHETLEILVEDFGGDQGWEVEYSSGVMTLSIPPHGTYVINKQPPNLQIWISSPFSGPGRFDYSLPSSSTFSSSTIGIETGNENGDPKSVVEKTWVHHRDSSIRLDELLDRELRQVLLTDGKEHSDWDGVKL